MLLAAVFGSPPGTHSETSAREPTPRSKLPFVGYRNVVGPTPAGARDEAAGPRTRGGSCGNRNNSVPASAHAGRVVGAEVVVVVVVAAGVVGMVAVVVLVVVVGVLTVVSTDVVAQSVTVAVVVVSVVVGSVDVVAAVVVGIGVVSAIAVPAHAAAAIAPSATAFQIS